MVRSHSNTLLDATVHVADRAPRLPGSASRHSPVGIHPRYPDQPREEPGPDEVGGPPRGRLQVPQVRGRGPDVGPEEEEHQYDI